MYRDMDNGEDCFFLLLYGGEYGNVKRLLRSAWCSFVCYFVIFILLLFIMFFIISIFFSSANVKSGKSAQWFKKEEDVVWIYVSEFKGWWNLHIYRRWGKWLKYCLCECFSDKRKKFGLHFGYIRADYDYRHSIDFEFEAFRLSINQEIKHAEICDNDYFLDINVNFFIIEQIIGKRSAAKNNYEAKK